MRSPGRDHDRVPGSEQPLAPGEAQLQLPRDDLVELRLPGVQVLLREEALGLAGSSEAEHLAPGLLRCRLEDDPLPGSSITSPAFAMRSGFYRTGRNWGPKQTAQQQLRLQASAVPSPSKRRTIARRRLRRTEPKQLCVR